MWRLALVGLVVVSGCTVRNSGACFDGICTTPERPFCDVNGEVAGTPDTCIAVSCMPGEVAACRGDQAITCNSAGTDYDLIQCALGCDATAGGCRECATNEQCPDAEPICDATGQACRGCRDDAECASEVCDLDSGTCTLESAIVYATPTGSSSGACDHAAPCSLSRAVIVATTAAVTPMLRMLPGTFQTSLVIDKVTSAPLVIIARGARITTPGATAITVTNGAKAVLRGVTTFGRDQIWCGEATSPTTQLEVTDSVLVGSSSAIMIQLSRCSMILRRSELSLNRAEVAMWMFSDVDVSVDRVHMHHTGTGVIVSDGARIHLQMTNSLLEGFTVQTGTQDPGPAPGSSFVFGFNTITVGPDPFDCGSQSGGRTVLVENSIITRSGAQDAVAGLGCTFLGTMLWPQSQPTVGGIVADPRYVDAAAHNYRLDPASPAIDAAVLSQSLVTTDLDGISRPQGPKPDLGAYERRP